MVHKYAHELFINGCRRTGTNLKVTKSQMGQYMRPLTNVGSRSRFNLATISSPLSPCKLALYEKKTEVIQGPYRACPMKIFFKVETKSRFGKSLDTKLNHKCCDGPKINKPYAAILNVLIKSKEPEAGDVILWEVKSAAAKMREEEMALVKSGRDWRLAKYQPTNPIFEAEPEEEEEEGRVVIV